MAYKYEYLLRLKFVAIEAKNYDELSAKLADAMIFIDQCRESGVVYEGDNGNDYHFFYTNDKEIAEKLGFNEVEEFEEEEPKN